MSYTKALQSNDAKAPDNYGTCMVCKAGKLKSMLAQYGGRCVTCFDAYCEPGVNSGMGGFVTGRRDTAVQAEMRRATKSGKAENVLQDEACRAN